jgi:hypothetical protein
MPLEGFDPATPVSETLQAYAIEPTVTGIGVFTTLNQINFEPFSRFQRQ